MNLPIIDDTLKNKTVLLRADFDVPIEQGKVMDDFRIQHALFSIKKLLEQGNKIIILSHLGRPKSVDPEFSLKPVQESLQALLPDNTITLLGTIGQIKLHAWKEKEIVMLENLRFFPEEEKNDEAFAQELASLGDVYVNDAFADSHRAHASIVGIPKHLPSYAGLQLSAEIEALSHFITQAEHPVVSIIGGAKVSTKIGLLSKLCELSDTVLVGGGIANTMFSSMGKHIGSSLYEKESLEQAKQLLTKKNIVIPIDVVLGNMNIDQGRDEACLVSTILSNETRSILDIGPQTQEAWRKVISEAKTILWNGPVGYIEKVAYKQGTQAVYQAIITNTSAHSIVGGGDTVAAISHNKQVGVITHLSTGGGAMLEFIEKGTLPGIEVLKKANH